MLIPFLRIESLAALEEGSELLQRVIRALEGYGIGGPVRVELPEEAFASSELRAGKARLRPAWTRLLSRGVEVILGVVPSGDAELLSVLLDSGFSRCVVNVGSPAEAALVMEQAGALPAARVVGRVCVQPGALASAIRDGTVDLSHMKELLDPLRDAVGGFEFYLAPEDARSEGLTMEAVEKLGSALREIASPADAVLQLPSALMCRLGGVGESVGEKLERAEDACAQTAQAALVGRLHSVSRIHVIAATVLPRFVLKGRRPSGEEEKEESVEAMAARGMGFLEGAVAFGPDDSKAAVELGAAVAQCARSDRPDGLYPTVVSDEQGVALGLVYSSDAALVEAVRCGRGVYYTRSRRGLWRKGDTSGAWQSLCALRLDCDSDAILVRVQQHGKPPSFCHTGARTCWLENRGLGALERTLQDRLETAPTGSYTKRLFEDHELLRNKLLEEAQELAEATEKDHVAAETADVLYFALVRAVKAGVSLADVEQHLDRRSLAVKRRPGNAKPERIAAAKAFFESKY